MKQATHEPPVELLPRVASRFAALADETRLRLLMRLRRGEANVAALTGELGVAQASVSKHLAVLRAAGLVECTRAGTRCVYRVRDGSVFDLCRIVCDGVVRHAEREHAALGRSATGQRGRW